MSIEAYKWVHTHSDLSQVALTSQRRSVKVSGHVRKGRAGIEPLLIHGARKPRLSCCGFFYGRAYGRAARLAVPWTVGSILCVRPPEIEPSVVGSVELESRRFAMSNQPAPPVHSDQNPYLTAQADLVMLSGLGLAGQIIVMDETWRADLRMQALDSLFCAVSVLAMQIDGQVDALWRREAAK